MDQQVVEQVGLQALLINLGLGLLNLALAIVSGSLALTAAAVDSATDVVASLAIWAGLRLSRRRSSAFPYGLYKLENVASVIVALLIFVAGYEIARATLLSQGAAPGVTAWVIVGAAVSVIVPVLFGRYASRVGARTGSPSLVAEGRHRQVDALSALVVLAALGASYLGWAVDRWAAVVVLLFIVHSGWELLSDGMRVLLDASMAPELLDQVRGIIDSEPGVMEVRSLTGRNSGRYRFIEVGITVRMRDVEKAYALTQRLETRIKDEIGRVDRVLVHYEPTHRGFTRYALPLVDRAGRLSEHFGEAPCFALVDIEEEGGQEIRREVVRNPHLEVSRAKGIRVAEWLVAQKVDVVLGKESLKGKGPEYVLEAAGVAMIGADTTTLDQAIFESRRGE